MPGAFTGSPEASEASRNGLPAVLAGALVFRLYCFGLHGTLLSSGTDLAGEGRGRGERGTGGWEGHLLVDTLLPHILGKP